MVILASLQHGRMSRRSAAASPAFALVDAIIATIVLGVALAVIIGLTARSLGSQALGEEIQHAAALADEQLAFVLARGPDEYAKRFALVGACDPPFAEYRYALTFTGGSGGDPYRVAAVVSWRSRASGLERSVTLETMIAPREGDEPDPERQPPELGGRPE